MDPGTTRPDMLLDEGSWPYAGGWQVRARWEELQHAQFLLWWLTAAEGEEVPARFRFYDIAPEPAVTEHGSVTVVVTEVHRDEGLRPFR